MAIYLFTEFIDYVVITCAMCFDDLYYLVDISQPFIKLLALNICCDDFIIIIMNEME